MNSASDSPAALEQMIARYNEAWNAHDLDAIVALHAPEMVFQNHTAGERAVGDGVREHIASIFDGWPDLRFETVRLYTREALVVQEWNAYATHTRTIKRGDIEAPATGKTLEWAGVDVIPTENGLILRKDVYSDSVGILRQLGLLN